MNNNTFDITPWQCLINAVLKDPLHISNNLLSCRMRTPEVVDLHPVGSVTALSHSPCLAVSHNLKYLLTCPAPLVPAIWKVADLRFSLRSLRGHKSPVTAAAFASNGDLIPTQFSLLTPNLRSGGVWQWTKENRVSDMQQG